MLNIQAETDMTDNAAGSCAPKKALILGLGATGLALARHMKRIGWAVRAADTRAQCAGAQTLSGEQPDAEISLGELSAGLLDGVGAVAISPGLSPFFRAAAPLVAEAKKRGIEVMGEIEVFARALRRLESERGYRPIVIGVTGTNGKTTTTSLTSKMAAASGRSTVAAGNIGPNAVAELDRAEDEGRLPDVWVLELSSFQLATEHSLECRSAALLNVTEDHIDWHGSLEAYAAAKARVFHPNTVRVVNREDKRTLALAAGGAMRTFGPDEPKKPGEYGLTKDGEGRLWLSCIGESGTAERLFPEDRLLIAGRHNTMNALAALALIEAAGLPRGPALEALAAYRGEPHRVERVLEFDGVTFVDDSKGTNVGAVEAAVRGFAAQGRRLLIVLGGDGKGQDFTPLAAALRGRTGAAALIGRDAGRIAEAIGGIGAPIKKLGTLEEAVDWLWTQRRSGDVLLLSPACASWDMFRNYAERSARFIACARKIAGRD